MKYAKFYRKYKKPYRGYKKNNNVYSIVKSLFNKHSETKMSDFYYSGIGGISNTWNETGLTSFSQSLTGSGRIGNKVELLGFNMDFVFESAYDPILTPDVFNVVRVVVGLYDIGGGLTPLTTSALTMDTPLRRDKCNTLISKYVDKTLMFVPPYGSVTTPGPQLRHLKKYIAFKRPISVEWTSATGTACNKSLYISCISDSSVVPNPQCIRGHITTYYKDL